MAEQPVVHVSRLLDERGVTSFHVKLIIWSIFIAFIDGYDIASIALAGPELVKDWHVSPAALAPVFYASLVGILFGSALFGSIGDRYGRKAALIGALMVFGVFSWGGVYATNLTEMFWLRLFAGLGIGGVIPNVIALNAESAPRRMRGTLALISISCVPFGGAIPGFVSVFLVPRYGWQVLFLVGGVTPILIALLALVGLPESPKFLAIHERLHGKLRKLIASIYPGYAIPADARFVVEDENQIPGINPAHLFRDGLNLITPLLWLLFALNLMGYFFLLSWTPTLLTAAHLPRETAALASLWLQVGGTFGSLLLAYWINKYRFRFISLLFVIAVPVVGSIGFFGVSSALSLYIAVFVAGFFVLGIQTGINVTGALVYPTSLRANGSGWSLGVGRVGSIIGPVLGGLFVALPVQQLYMWSALPFAGGAIVCYAIYRLNETRLAERPWMREGQQAPAE